MVAAQLATAGKRVLVIEKGTYYHESEMVAEEAEAFRNLYELGGACTSTDGKVTFLAGSNFGGGTLVNYSVCLKVQQPLLPVESELTRTIHNVAALLCA